MLIYHITQRDAWENSQSQREYRAESLQTEGFIHCSTNKQVARVANSLYKGQDGLVLLVIDPAQAYPDLRWEPPSHVAAPLPDGNEPTRELFPHLYGPLNVDAVVRVVDFPPGKDGRFAFPKGTG